MPQRYQVARKYVRHKGKIYSEGDLLPENFTERDRMRNLYSRRLTLIEILDGPLGLPNIVSELNTEDVPNKETAVDSSEIQSEKTSVLKNPTGTKGVASRFPVKK